MQGIYVVVLVMGKRIVLVQCPYCQEFQQLKHGTMKADKVHLCEECEEFFAEPHSKKGILHVGTDTSGVGWPD